jgi:sugar phosphate isomerase/epimerase
MKNSVSVLQTSFPSDFVGAVRKAATMGFTHIDLVAHAERPEQEREVLAESGLVVSCVSLGRGLNPECRLDAASADQRAETLEALKLHLADAARLGATHAYVVPGTDASPAALARFGEACAQLADYAGERKVRLGVEHFPGGALPSVAATLVWLDQVGHPGLGLLLDIGHCLISREDPALAVAQAGPRLAYVHLDDNDGVHDRHWPLLAGQLTQAMLQAFLQALHGHGYSAALALELNAAQPGVEDGLVQGRRLLEELLTKSVDFSAG